MKILITGGCGFLGTNLSSHFLKLGCQVVIIDALYRKGASSNLKWLKELNSNGKLFSPAPGEPEPPSPEPSVFLPIPTPKLVHTHIVSQVYA